MSESDNNHCGHCNNVDYSSSSPADSESSDRSSDSSDGRRRRHWRRRDSDSSESYCSSESEHDWIEAEIYDQDEPLPAASNQVKVRSKRSTHSNNHDKHHNKHHHNRHHGRHHDRKHKDHRRRDRGWKMTKVKMPTGKKFYITKPNIRPGWKCGDKTKMITMKPNGYVGKREHTIIMKELQNTMIDIPFAIGRGGVYTKYNIVKLQKLINPCLWKRYRFWQYQVAREAGFVNEQMLFHGSLKAGEIAGTGFDERYANYNGVFGAGLYFACSSTAANEYTYGILGGSGCPAHLNKNCYVCERQMLLCRVTLGKQFKTDVGQHFAHAPRDHHSVLGRNGPTSYQEFVIYRGEQAYPEYLITYTIVP